MANALLPAELHRALPLRCPLEPVDTRSGFQPDVGPAIQWPMTTDDPFSIQVSGLHLWTYQREILEAFGKTDLVGWALPFDWVEPWPGAGKLTFRFALGGKPRYVPIAPARVVDGRPEQVLYETSFRLDWFPWFPPAQVG
jgi:hypothetical protein